MGADVGFVVVGGFHQTAELAKEGIGIEGNRGTDMDLIVVGFTKSLLFHQLFFIELFAGAQAGIDNLDIDIRFIASELDQIAGEGIDLHRGAHIEDEDFAAVGIGAGQHDEGDGFLHRHEIADDIGMGNRDRAAFFDLLFEDGNHRTVGAQDVAEAHSHEFGSDIPESILRDRIVRSDVGIKRRNLGCSAGFDLFVKRLDDHFAQTLAGTHDVDRIDRLVRADQDEALTAVQHGGIGRAVGAEGIILNGLAGAVFHEGHMLVGRSMVDDLRAVGMENLCQAAAVTDRTNKRDQVKVRVFLLQLQLDGIGVVFVNVKND